MLVKLSIAVPKHCQCHSTVRGRVIVDALDM